MMSSFDKPTVLVVDDMPDNISLLTGILSRDYRVKASNNGKSAINLALKAPPHIILLDVMMGGMDGYEVCRQLKADPRTRNIPVIFVTALGNLQNEQRGFEAGAVDYITKPFSPSIVLARVKTHLSLQRQNTILEEEVKSRTKELEQSRFEIIHRLGLAAEFRDNETGKHVIRIGYITRILALAMGLDRKEADIILNAAPMHDVGKIGIPDSILQKPGPLTKMERDIMKRHARLGADLIGEHRDSLLSTAASAALNHHERWDGAGYPRGLKEEEIPLIGRLTAIADVFDALTSKRPYKDPWPEERAIDYIKEESGRQFDPNLVPLFTENIEEILEIRKANSDEGEMDY